MPAKQVNLYEAKTHLSRLVDEAHAGAEVIIAKDGKPMAKLVPIDRQQRKFGTAKGEPTWMADGFDDPLPEDMLKDIAP